MKNLNIYNKINLQKNIIYIDNWLDTIQIYINQNLIGFENEYYLPSDRNYCNSIDNVVHFNYKNNFKLYVKYPEDVYKKDYKKWLKEYNEKLKSKL